VGGECARVVTDGRSREDCGTTPGIGCLIACALAATTAATFARPAYRDDIPVVTVELSEESHLGTTAVERAFADAGVHLTSRTQDPVSKLTWLGAGPPPHDERSL
jgi:hypothetical protein